MLVANPTKARQKPKWCPTVNFEQLVQMMVEADLERLGKEIA
jgi:GDPmannose 4,6-dehydratase